jgi:hypothetical protein
MSVDLCVFLRDERLPTYDQLQSAIDAAGVDLQLEPFSTREHSGLVPARLRGMACGFEYYFHPVEEEPEEVRREFGDRNRVVTFVLHGGPPEELQSAILCAAVLTRLADGAFLDPQSGEFARGDGVLELFRQYEEERRERGKRATEKDAAITSRRCPQCGSPCPEYRKTCKACGFEVGRAL